MPTLGKKLNIKPMLGFTVKALVTAVILFSVVEGVLKKDYINYNFYPLTYFLLAAILVWLWAVSWGKKAPARVESGAGTPLVKEAFLNEGLKLDQLQALWDSVSEGMIMYDHTGKMIYANSAASDLVGMDNPQELMQTPGEKVRKKFEIFDESGEPLSSSQLPHMKILAGEKANNTVIKFKVRATGQERWSRVVARKIYLAGSEQFYIVTNIHDITPERSITTTMEQAEARQKFLAEAGEILSSSLDYKVTLKQIAKLAVPKLADWAAIDMVIGPDQVERLVVEHQDPAKVKWAYEIQQQTPYDPKATTGLPKVIRSGEVEFYPHISQEMIKATVKDPKALKLLEEIGGLSALMIVPLKILNQTVGAISFVNAESGKVYTSEDLELAKELARRASLAIQNSKLYEAAQTNAEKERRQTQLFNTLLTNAPVGFAFLNKQFEYVLINPVMASMNRFSIEEHLGKSMLDMFPEYRSYIEPRLREVLETGKPLLNLEYSGEVATDPGRIHHWLSSYYPVRDENFEITGIGLIVEEITERKTSEREIYFRANHDALTLLPNRKYFQEQLAQVVAEGAGNPGQKAAVMFIDLDRLKDINDTLGHHFGDEVLKEVSSRVISSLPRGDLVARWGGDEFVVLAKNISTNYDAEKRARNVLKAVEPIMRVSDQNLHITASIGIAMFPQDGNEIYTLQKNADTALYRAKEAGKNRYEFYKQAMNVKAGERLTLENDLRQALKKDELEIHYQPILDLKTNTFKSAEALLRWRHPKLGTLLPAVFIPIAEEIGIISQLGRWVLTTAAQQIKEIHEAGYPLVYNVNISARQFLEIDLVSIIFESLEQVGMPPEFLELEVTESLAMENIDRTQGILEELRNKGIGITVDDFGTGYSSLNYLKQFPLGTLKIDKTFIKHIVTDEQDTSLVKGVISLAKSLHLKVVAEGVDTDTQMALLESLGCDAAQGFYISRPLTRHELLEFLKQRQPLRTPENTLSS